MSRDTGNFPIQLDRQLGDPLDELAAPDIAIRHGNRSHRTPPRSEEHLQQLSRASACGPQNHVIIS